MNLINDDFRGYSVSEFYKYFKENMDDLGLPAPESLFGNAQLAVASAIAIATQIDKFGPKVLISDIVGAGTKLEILVVVGSCGAAFYAGAVIGSIAVATGCTLSGGLSMSEALESAGKYNLNRAWVAPQFHRYPGMYNVNAAGRNLYPRY